MTFSELTLGSLRKLENIDVELAEKFKHWLEKRDEYRISIRIVHLLTVVFVIYCATSYAAQTEETVLAILTPLILIALGYLLISECLGFDLSQLAGRVLLRIAIPVVAVSRYVTLPVSFPIIQWRRFIARGYGNGQNGDERATAEDEIISLVEHDEEMAEEQGAELEEDERRMIKGVFDLDETHVREIMTPRVDIDAVENGQDMAEARRVIARTGHTRIPIYDKSIDHIGGILHAKDLLNEEKLAQAGSLRELASPASFIPESKNIGDLLEEFQQMLVQMAVVVDEYGGTAGIVTLEDIIEEVVGEIHDEYDLLKDEPTIRRLPAGGVIVNARTPLAELNSDLNLHIPEEYDFDTLGGYVSYVLGRIPEKGEVLETQDFHLEIMGADQRRILKAKLIPKSQPSEFPPQSKNNDADEDS
ncbi:MAG: hemolysin family protein [Lentisphaeria bacterium]